MFKHLDGGFFGFRNGRKNRLIKKRLIKIDGDWLKKQIDGDWPKKTD
jgi:hypothetical protein